MGEEVAEYQGAYKVTQGPAAGIRRAARHRHADHRARLCRRRRRRGVYGPAADRRVHDLQLRHAGDRPDHQLGRQDPLHVGRPARLPDRVPRPQRRRGPRRRAAQPGLSPPGIRTCPASRSSRPIRRPTPRACSRARSAIPTRSIFLENEILYGQSFPVPKLDDFMVPIGKARIHRAGQGRHDRVILDRHDLRAQGRRGAGEGRHRARR